MNRLKVLFIEDSKDFSDLFKLDFGKTGFQADFKTFLDGESAVEYLNSIKDGSSDDFGMPNLVITDLILPGISGFEVIRAVRTHAKLSKVPIIVLSSTDKADDFPKAYAKGATVFLRKTWEMDALRDVLLQLRVAGVL